MGTISRLKAGELTLSQALREQAAVLEADRGDLERYAQVCLEMSRTEVDFGTLDPEPWLKELESRPLPPSRQVDLSRDSIAAAPYPWRRYFARGLDVGLCICLWMAVRYLVLEWYAPDQVLDGALRSLADMYGGWLFLFLLEPILLAGLGLHPRQVDHGAAGTAGGRPEADMGGGGRPAGGRFLPRDGLGHPYLQHCPPLGLL